jgi:hypothetical protein
MRVVDSSYIGLSLSTCWQNNHSNMLWLLWWCGEGLRSGVGLHSRCDCGRTVRCEWSPNCHPLCTTTSPHPSLALHSCCCCTGWAVSTYLLLDSLGELGLHCCFRCCTLRRSTTVSAFRPVKVGWGRNCHHIMPACGDCGGTKKWLNVLLSSVLLDVKSHTSFVSIYHPRHHPCSLSRTAAATINLKALHCAPARNAWVRCSPCLRHA